MTLGVGLLFMLITSSRAWMVFGFACGAALSFLLANTIIYRSAKAMLRGSSGSSCIPPPRRSVSER